MKNKIIEFITHGSGIALIQGVSDAPIDEWIKILTQLAVACAALYHLFKPKKDKL